MLIINRSCSRRYALDCILWAESRLAVVVRSMLRFASLYEIVCIGYVFIYYGDSSIFTKFNMITARYVAFVGGSRGTTHEGPFMGTILCNK